MTGIKEGRMVQGNVRELESYNICKEIAGNARSICIGSTDPNEVKGEVCKRTDDIKIQSQFWNCHGFVEGPNLFPRACRWNVKT